MKKKGAALVLTLLMLSFFMVTSLSIYYFGRKKSDNARVKIQGVEDTQYIDIGSILAYYELFNADQYVVSGKVYDSDHPVFNLTTGALTYKSYSPPITAVTTGNALKFEHSSDGTVIGIPVGDRVYGMALGSYNEYFGARWVWNATSGSIGTTDQGIVINEYYLDNIETELIRRRDWSSEVVYSELLDTKIERLVYLDEEISSPGAISVGGYRLTMAWDCDVTTNPSIIVGPIATHVNNIVATNPDEICIQYEKFLTISDEDIDIVNEGESFHLQYIERVPVTGGALEFTNSELESFIVERQRP